jgi:hypothetical protein
MIEYLWNAIRAIAGDTITIEAYITDTNEEIITEGCTFALHDKDGTKMLLAKNGTYLPEFSVWQFTLEPEETKDLKGKYFYCIKHNDSPLCFKQPIYLT